MCVQAAEQPRGIAAGDTAAKLRRSQRFGDSLKQLPQVPASLTSPAVQPIRFGPSAPVTTTTAAGFQPSRAAASEPMVDTGDVGGDDEGECANMPIFMI